MVQLVKHDLEFILKQIKIAEAHAAGGDLATLVGEAGFAIGAGGPGALQPHLLPYGLRTVDGSYNNLVDGRETWGAADHPFMSLVPANYVNDADGDTIMFGTPANPVWLTNTDYTPGSSTGSPMLPPGTVVDADPRTISNLIVDQTSNNPAAIMVYESMLAEGKNATRTEMTDANGVTLTHASDVIGFDGSVLAAAGTPVYSYTFENWSPDIGDSMPYNSMFTLFGQFFDHGLDLVAKGGAGTVYIPLSPDDPLYNPATPHTNFMALTRSTRTADGEVAANTTTPWIDQNQTYTSHASHQVFLREYAMVEGKPVATGHLLEGARGLATWADVKAQALEKLGILLTDADVGNIPLLRTDQYGNFIPDANGFAQVVVGIGADGIPNTADDAVISGTPGAPVATTAAVRIGHAFLDDIAHAAAPVITGGVLQPDSDSEVGYSGGFNTRGNQTSYDNELLDAHYITGDGRGNENIGLTSIHHIFHSEHNRVVEQTKDVVLASGDLAFINEWLLVPVTEIPTDKNALLWDGERLFQAGRFTTEMQYQHLVFEEFGRKMQPDIDAFVFEPSVDINPAIFAEFAHAVYRFGHSMLNQDIDRLVDNGDGTFSFDNITLFDGFLNPLELGVVDAAGNVIVDHDTAAGAVIRGMSRQGGNEIDEFVTDVLRNQLVGIPLDLAALNIARGRDVGLPTLNEARAAFYQMAGQVTQLKPYESWADFAINMQNPASIVNFVAAYGLHPLITAETTIDGKRLAAAAIVLGGAGAPEDRLDFLNSTGAWANQESGLNTIDLWMGGLAEKKMDFGSMLGSTFSFVFELQMENLQDADRFYYLSRVQGLNLLNELENNSLSEIIMRNTDLGEAGRTALPGDIFSTPDLTLEMDQWKQMGADPVQENPILQAFAPLVVRRDLDGDGDIDYLRYNGTDHIVVGGTTENDTIITGEGDDTVWGYEGDDTIEAGYGTDKVHGGEGDDIITSAGTDFGATDFLHGDEGNDAIQGGNALALIFGGAGQDFIITGPDGKEAFGGTGNDFIRGGDGGDFLLGNEGDDWLEGGARFDTLAGENSELFFNSTIIGHDVMNGHGGDVDYDGESGDDIMFQNDGGIQRSNGMAGFDWGIHKGDSVAAYSDLGIPIFATQEAFILRDRFDLVEGLSGWKLDDNLTGRVVAVNTRAEAEGTAAIPANGSILDSYSNDLLEKNVDLIAGLRPLVSHLARTTVTVAGRTEQIVMNTADASDILLGGGGSDIIKGLGGNDIIDGDKWLNVRIRFVQNGVAYTTDSMTDKVYREADYTAGAPVAGAVAQFGGKTLDALVFARTVNPGALTIVREIVDGDPTNSAIDTAVFTDVFANYTFIRNDDGSVSVDHIGFIPNNNPGEIEGVKIVSDGVDRLFNIERLRFTDGDKMIAELPFAAFGAPVIVDPTPTNGLVSPTAGQPLTVNTSAIQDLNGIASPFTYQWQVSVNGGTTWTNIAGATGASFSPGAGVLGQAGDIIRVRVGFTDGIGFGENVFSAPTGVVGDNWNAIPFIANTFNGTAGDDIANGTSGVLGLGAADTLNGAAGNDTLNGAGGTDTLNGGTGDDRLDGGAGTDTAVFAGGVRQFTFGLNGAGQLTVTDLIGAEGTDTLTTIETLRFAGVNLALVNGTDAAGTVTGSGAADLILGQAGADSINGFNGNDVLVGGLGNDVLLGSAGNDQILWRVGDGRDVVNGDTLVTSGGTDTFHVLGDGSAEHYRIYSRAEALAAGITGLTAATEIVITRNGTNNAAIIAELDNVEEIVINGRGGGDTFTAIGSFTGTSLSTSTITLEGGAESDVVDISRLTSEHRIHFFTNGGNDTIVGTARPQDVIETNGAPLPDYVLPGSSDMSPAPVGTPAAPRNLVGTLRGETLYGDTGDDNINGAGGDDTLYGMWGDDVLSGGLGDDLAKGGSGNDTLSGGAGDDILEGGAGNDRLSGGIGNDVLIGGAGVDVLTGGGGLDLFVFDGDDHIADFTVGTDLIVLGGRGITAANFATRVEIAQENSGTKVIVDGETMLLRNVSFDTVSISSFLLTDELPSETPANLMLAATNMMLPPPDVF